MNAPVDDVDLLAVELDTLWETDDRGRLCGSVNPWPQLAVGVARDGRTAAIGSDVPDALAAELRAVVQSRARHERPGEPPVELDDCVRLLRALGPVTVTSGPSFVVPAGTAVAFDPAPRRSAGIGADTDLDLMALRPVDWWEPGEWRELLSGDLGPWAMSLEAGRVAALCHTSRLTARAVEAGVWTHPDHRRQGRAAAVTAAWAAHPQLGERIRFYSTSADNVASQGVAARLSLHPIGWIWKLTVERAPDEQQS